MYRFIYPLVGTIANFILTTIAYLPFTVLVELQKPFNVCEIKENIEEKFELLFAGYGVVFSISPLIFNVVLNSYVTIKLR